MIFGRFQWFEYDCIFMYIFLFNLLGSNPPFHNQESHTITTGILSFLWVERKLLTVKMFHNQYNSMAIRQSQFRCLPVKTNNNVFTIEHYMHCWCALWYRLHGSVATVRLHNISCELILFYICIGAADSLICSKSVND